MFDNLEQKCEKCNGTGIRDKRIWSRCQYCTGGKLLTEKGEEFIRFLDRWLDSTTTIDDIKSNFRNND